MNSDSELTKPLKRPESRGDTRSSRRLAIAVTCVAMFLAVPMVHFYGGFNWLGSQLDGNDPANIPIASEQDQTPANQNTSGVSQVSQDTVVPDQSGVLENSGQVQKDEPVAVVVPKPLPKIIRQEPSLAHLPDPELIERGATGVIPKRSKDGLRPMDVYSRPPDTEGNFGVARVVIVIGGLGISQTTTQKAIKELPGGITLAFAPYGNSLSRWVQRARKDGHEFLLQVPMEPLDYPQNNPGPHTLKADADYAENQANLHWSMSRITNYVGITNYLGNRMLQQPASLQPMFSEVAERGLLFFDDGTVKNSVADGVSVKTLLPFAKADVLIDNVRSRSAISQKLDQLSQQARRTGLAIGAGNAFPDTIALVSQYAREAKANGIEITPLSSVVRDPGR